MECKQFFIGQYECVLLNHDNPEVLILQPVGADAIEYLRYEDYLLRTGSHHRFALFAFTITDWERELAPWPDPLLFKGDVPTTDAPRLLDDITHGFLPFLRRTFGDIPCVLAGYSLAGLFALWCGYQSDCFDAIAGVSPSVWIRDWTTYAHSHQPQAQVIYLSQGDKEGKTRHPVFSQVAANIMTSHDILCSQLGAQCCCLEWNKGNHFMDTDKRTARGIIWCMNHILTSSCATSNTSQT